MEDSSWQRWLGRFEAGEATVCVQPTVSNSPRTARGSCWQPGDRFDTEELARRLGVAAQHLQQLNRMLGWLAEDGLLRRDREGWEVLRPTGTLTR